MAATSSESKRQRRPSRFEKVDGTVKDLWTQVPASKDDPIDAPVMESSFATLFPKYREKYLREVWTQVTAKLREVGVNCKLDLVQGSMSVATSRNMFDPYAIIKAKEMIQLLARSVPLEQAQRILEDEVQSDIIKIGQMVANKERFARRRQRLIGPNGSTLKALELLTGCYILVHGRTVAALGSFKGLKEARRVVEECMDNFHPVYNIKRLMIKRELAKDPELANEDWSRFLPEFKHKNVKRKKPLKVRAKKAYTPFPPAPTLSKVDKAIESGEFFLSEAQKRKQASAERKARQAEKRKAKDDARAKDFVAPKESKRRRSLSASASSSAQHGAASAAAASAAADHDTGLEALAKKASAGKAGRGGANKLSAAVAGDAVVAKFVETAASAGKKKSEAGKKRKSRSHSDSAQPARKKRKSE